MYVTHQGGWFHFHDAFELKDTLKAKCMWNPKTKTWQTRDWGFAYRYRDMFKSSAVESINLTSLRKVVHKVEIDFESIVPTGLKLDDDQQHGVKFILSRNHSYLNFEAGVGKTATSIVAMNFLANFSPAPHLVICPPHLVSNWVEEINTWGTHGYNIQTVTKRSDVLDASADIYIVANSILGKVKGTRPIVDQILKKLFASIYIDEAHQYQSPDADRTQVVMSHTNQPGLGIVHRGLHVVLLSGTAVRRSPMSLYTAIQALAWNRIKYMSLHHYGLKFCNAYLRQVTATKKFWDYSGVSDVELWRKLFRKRFILYKKLKLDIDVTRRLLVLDSGKSTKVFKKLDAKFLKYEGDKSFSAGEIATYRKELGQLILKPGLSYILDQMNTSRKQFLILGWHREVLEELYQELEVHGLSVGLIHGGVTAKNKKKIIDAFQKGSLKGVVAQVQTMVGVNMQQGSRAIFLESSFAWDDNHQAERRIVRRGQNKNCVIDYLCLANSYQMQVLKTSLNKEKTANQLMKGK